MSPKFVNRPAASVIIPVFNRVNYTYRCLKALSRHATDLRFEVVIVDNGSSDGTADLLASLSGDVRVITNPRNLGFARASNQGAKAARGRYLVFLNNDTEPQPGWLEAMVQAREQNPKVRIVGCKLLYPDGGGIQHAGVVFNNRGEPHHIFRKLPADHHAVNQTEYFQAVTAACMLIDRAGFMELGLFDEGYVNGFEDVDLCLKAGQKGWKVLYTPKAVVLHYESLSAGRKQHEVDNYQRLMERWKDKILWDENRYYAKIGVRLEYDEKGGIIRSLKNPAVAKRVSFQAA
jgi:O-antigen biosynthesis protein